MDPTRRLPPTNSLFFRKPGQYEFRGELPNAKVLRICLDVINEEFIDENDNQTVLWGLEGSVILSSPNEDEERIHSIGLRIVGQGHNCWIGSWHPIIARPGEICENCTDAIPYELMGSWGNQIILEVGACSEAVVFDSWYVSPVVTPSSP